MSITPNFYTYGKPSVANARAYFSAAIPASEYNKSTARFIKTRSEPYRPPMGRQLLSSSYSGINAAKVSFSEPIPPSEYNKVRASFTRKESLPVNEPYNAEEAVAIMRSSKSVALPKAKTASFKELSISDLLVVLKKKIELADSIDEKAGYEEMYKRLLALSTVSARREMTKEEKEAVDEIRKLLVTEIEEEIKAYSEDAKVNKQAFEKGKDEWKKQYNNLVTVRNGIAQAENRLNVLDEEIKAYTETENTAKAIIDDLNPKLAKIKNALKVAKEQYQAMKAELEALPPDERRPEDIETLEMLRSAYNALDKSEADHYKAIMTAKDESDDADKKLLAANNEKTYLQQAVKEFTAGDKKLTKIVSRTIGERKSLPITGKAIDRLESRKMKALMETMTPEQLDSAFKFLEVYSAVGEDRNALIKQYISTKGNDRGEVRQLKDVIRGVFNKVVHIDPSVDKRKTAPYLVDKIVQLSNTPEGKNRLNMLRSVFKLSAPHSYAELEPVMSKMALEEEKKDEYRAIAESVFGIPKRKGNILIKQWTEPVPEEEEGMGGYGGKGEADD